MMFTDRLRHLVRQPDHEMNLAEAALLLAGQAYPELEIDAYLSRLDALAHSVRDRLSSSASVADKIFTLNHILFEQEGFCGAQDDYYDPRNSYLNEVLDRRCGIPITLSILYLEVGRRIGLALEGVSFPGHFLVKLPVQGGDIVLDPFLGGVSLSEDELELRLEQATAEHDLSSAPLGVQLRSARNRDILVRMLRNLKAIYHQTGELEKVLGVANGILLVAPELAVEVRDRGLILAAMECARSACEDLERYLQLAPEAEDAEYIRGQLIELAGEACHLH